MLSTVKFPILLSYYNKNAACSFRRHFLLSVNAEEKAADISERLLANRIKIPLLKDFYYTNVPKEKENIFVVNYSGIQKNAIAKIIGAIEKSLKL